MASQRNKSIHGIRSALHRELNHSKMDQKEKQFILIIGPPAVGKMTVGRAISDKLDYVLFHNHHSIEIAHELFHWGTPDFKKVNEGIRQLVFQTATESDDINGLIFTLVLDFNLKEDWDYLSELKSKFTKANWKFSVLELAATLENRLDRNTTPFRLENKNTKRDLEKSKANLLKSEVDHRMNSEFKERATGYQWIFINNDDKLPEEVADLFIAS